MRDIYISATVILIAIVMYLFGIIGAIKDETEAIIAQTEAVMTNDDFAEALKDEYCRGWQECKEFYLFEEG